MELWIVHKYLLTHSYPHSTKLLQNRLFRTIIVPVLILPTTNVLLVILSQTQCYSLFHFFVCPRPANVRLKTLSLYTLLMIFLDSLLFNPHLVFIIVLPSVFGGLRVGPLDWEDLIATIFDCLEKGREVKIWDYFRQPFVSAIEVIPYIFYFPEGKPMIRRVADEPLLFDKIFSRFYGINIDHM